MGRIIGCDLGTGNSVVTIYEGNKVTVIPNSEGAFTTPSVVAFTPEGRLVGRVAKSQAITNPSRTIASAKRFMGRVRGEVDAEEKLVSYKLSGEIGQPIKIGIDDREIFPQEISAAVLSDLKKSAEAYLGGEKVTDIVCCCPAYFNSAQREATSEACRISGMVPRRILAEPTSAALAYGVDKNKNQLIAVTDLGSGTWDFSLVRIESGTFEVIATGGDSRLGGDDWDGALVNYVSDEFKKTSGFDIRTDPMALQRLYEACEKCKCDLSSVAQATINLPYITAISGIPQHMSMAITREKFNGICAPLFDRLRPPVDQVLRDAKVHPNDVSEILLVGGASRMLRAQEIFKEIFHGRELNKSVSPDLCVGMGAAIQASILSGDITDIILIDVTPLSLGVEVQGGLASVLIPKNSSIPTSKSEVYSTASDNQPAVDIHVLQGERKLASGNRTLGRFQMTGLPLAARGVPQIEVNFDIDANGILKVTAKDKLTGKEHQVEIKNSSGLDKADVERMTREAKQYEQEDLLKFELIEARNEADNLVFQTEKFMRDNTKAITASIHANVKTAIDAMRAVMGVGTKQQILSGKDALEVANKAMYEQCFAGQQTKPVPPNSNDNIDAAKFTLL